MPEVQFVMAGGMSSGDFAKSVVSEAQDLRNVSYLGQSTREEIRWLFQHATAMIFPSRLEGLPLAVIEALGMGLPVLACPESSLPELISPGVNGSLTPVEDVAAWKKVMELWLSLTSERRGDLRKCLRTDAIAKYSWNAVAQAYGQLYRSLVGN
jgi:glycosyltransferase involved in cell wall biosynthesis